MASVLVVVFSFLGYLAFEFLNSEAEILDDLRCFVAGFLRMSSVRDVVIVRVLDSACYSRLVCDLTVLGGWVNWLRVILA